MQKLIIIFCNLLVMRLYTEGQLMLLLTWVLSHKMKLYDYIMSRLLGFIALKSGLVSLTIITGYYMV